MDQSSNANYAMLNATYNSANQIKTIVLVMELTLYSMDKWS